jgi:hypothetical protein
MFAPGICSKRQMRQLMALCSVFMSSYACTANMNICTALADLAMSRHESLRDRTCERRIPSIRICPIKDIDILVSDWSMRAVMLVSPHCASCRGVQYDSHETTARGGHLSFDCGLMNVIRQVGPRYRKFKRPEPGGGQAYDRPSGVTALVV